MYLIYWKNTVAKAVASLCQQQNIDYKMCDDSDNITDFSEFEVIIPSPGVPSSHRIYKTGKILAELDFAFQFLPKNFQVFAITGTDGKSTTTWILYSILQKYFFDKKKVYISGNFEIPFSQTVCEILQKNEKEGIIVVEISSFMSYFIGKNIFHIPPFSPDFSLLTNLKIDHLNWHADLQEYYEAKMNLLENTKKQAIINQQLFDFEKKYHISPKNITQSLLFGLEKSLWNFTDGKNIFIENKKLFGLSQTNFSGVHNAMNFLSIFCIFSQMKLDLQKIISLLPEVFWLPHRLEDIGMVWKVRVIDDSKSTSAQSLEAALGSFGDQKNILLVAGGSDKWDSFDHLENIFKKRVKSVACIGATKKHFSDLARKSEIDFFETDNMQEAVNWLYNHANQDDILMLSPGCASFGLFTDYLDRANAFREAIIKIPV